LGFAAAASFPQAQSLLGLPAGWARGLGYVGGDAYLDYWCTISLATGALIDPAGSLVLYLAIAQDPQHFTDGIDPNSPLDQSAMIGVATQTNFVQRLGGVGLLPNTRYSFNDFSIKAALGGTPTYWAPLVLNLSGGPLSISISPYATYTLQT
jgi:hypothetical protein